MVNHHGKIKKESYLFRSSLDARRMLLFMVGQVFLPMWELAVNAQWRVSGSQKAEEISSCLSFSSLAIKYQFYFIS